MSPQALRAAIEATGLTHQRVADCLGVELRTLRSWLYGERTPQKIYTRILRLAAAGRLDLNELEQ